MTFPSSPAPSYVDSRRRILSPGMRWLQKCSDMKAGGSFAIIEIIEVDNETSFRKSFLNMLFSSKDFINRITIKLEVSNAYLKLLIFLML